MRTATSKNEKRPDGRSQVDEGSGLCVTKCEGEECWGSLRVDKILGGQICQSEGWGCPNISVRAKRVQDSYVK